MPFFGFKGGVHPPDKKAATSGVATTRLKVEEGELVTIPLSQHIGAPAKALVKKKDRVRVGQKIGEAAGFISANIHSSVDGEVVNIAPIPHPIAGKVPGIIIKADGEPTDFEPIEEKKRMQEYVLEAGITGLGGATFPTHVKLSPPKKVDYLIINGAECEPYLTCDHRLMLERTEDVIRGSKLIQKELNIEKLIIAVEKNKPDAIELFEQKAAEYDYEFIALQTKYPQGGEKQLIKACVDRVVPEGKLPLEVGVIVHNVGTAISILEAVEQRKPLYERVVTVTGAVKEPKNLLVSIGTPIQKLIDECGGFVGTPRKIVAGGPMMGFSISSLETPVMKGVSGVIVFTEEDIGNLTQRNCIRCGRCIEVCPMALVPSLMDRFVVKELYEELHDWHVLNCIECGCCSYVCPSKRSLASGFKTSKRQVMKILKERESGE